MTEAETYIQAVAWVRDELERDSCMADDDSQRYAEGFVSGLCLGLRKGNQGSLVINDEGFWRGNLRFALEWERSIMDEWSLRIR